MAKTSFLENKVPKIFPFKSEGAW